jgi:hypothetical protein
MSALAQYFVFKDEAKLQLPSSLSSNFNVRYPNIFK